MSMAVTDFFVGEIATKLLKMLIQISHKSVMYKTRAEQLITTINELLPTICEIRYSSLEMPPELQFHMDRLSEALNRGMELAQRIMNSGNWNVYRTIQLLRKMEKVEKDISLFLNGPLQTYILAVADVHRLRFDTSVGQDRLEQRLDCLEQRLSRVEQQLGGLRIGGGGLFQEPMSRVEEQMEID